VSEEGGQELLLVTFVVAGAHYGLDTTHVQETVSVGKVTPVHRAPPYVHGVMNLRGKIVTVVNLGLKIGERRSLVSAASHVVIVSWFAERVGLLVDGISDVIPVDRTRIEAAPTNVGEIQGRFLEGLYRDGERLVAVLDLDEVLTA
jgi:purine-binding chemotaxis protein CheW